VTVLEGTCKACACDYHLACTSVNSMSILLNNHYNAKLGDFGFSVEIPVHEAGRTIITATLIAHSEGCYPTKIDTGKFNTKSDVYIFGIVGVCNQHSMGVPECTQSLSRLSLIRCPQDIHRTEGC